MRIAVVGARGQLGAALVHECAAAHETTAWSRAELDVSDEAAVMAAMARVKPEVILNAAAFTNVDAAEDRPIEALNSNAFGVRVLARAAGVHGAALVHYSTDFVFDGLATTPYLETDSPNPQSVYAASKLLGEWFARDAPRAYVLRVEGLFGYTPGAAPAKGSAAGILAALQAGGEAKVFMDRTITPSYVSDVARATRRLIETAAPAWMYI
jgi:dTDP-4-dehydrorhamnose reductase